MPALTSTESDLQTARRGQVRRPAGSSMDEEQQSLAQAKRFDLLTNPFSILDVDLTASLQQIASAFDAAAADHVAASDIAREVLVDPRYRISAELSFLLDAHAQEIRPLL